MTNHYRSKFRVRWISRTKSDNTLCTVWNIVFQNKLFLTRLFELVFFLFKLEKRLNFFFNVHSFIDFFKSASLPILPYGDNHLLTTFQHSGLIFLQRVCKHIWPYLSFFYRSLTFILYSWHSFLLFQPLSFHLLIASNFLSGLYISPIIYNGK